MKEQNYKQSTKKILQRQEAEATTTTLITTFKENFGYIIIVLCAISFYSYQFLDERSEVYSVALNSHKAAKKERTRINKEIIKKSKGTKLYDQFHTQNKKTNLLWNDFLKVKKNEQFFGFKTLKIFSKEFGVFFGFFMYALFNLYRSFRYERFNIGIKIYHSFIISVCVFYFFWIFQQFQDFSKPMYFLMTLAAAYFVFLAMHLLFKNKKTKEERLRANLMEVAKFTFKNTKPEKREEMLDLIKEIAANK